MLIELGLVGGALFVLIAFLAVRLALRAALRAPPDPERVQYGYVAAGWVAGMAGALAGAALFGGSPLASLFWLTLGVVAAIPLLVVEPRP